MSYEINMYVSEGPIAERSNLLDRGRDNLSLNPDKGWQTKGKPYCLPQVAIK